jgi:hypothetical protein
LAITQRFVLLGEVAFLIERWFFLHFIKSILEKPAPTVNEKCPKTDNILTKQPDLPA